MATTSASTGADQAYRTGPEDLIAQATEIAIGVVSSYSKQVSKPTSTDPNMVPSAWTVNGILTVSEYLKGRGQEHIAFVREERSFGLPAPQGRPEWQNSYGNLRPGEKAVVLVLGAATGSDRVILPSGSGEQDLAALVKATANIQAVTERTTRVLSWVHLAQTTKLDVARKVALRSLLKENADFSVVSALLDSMLSDKSLSADMRGYLFGFVVFGVIHGSWYASPQIPVDFLCRKFEQEKEPDILFKYLLSFKLLIRYSLSGQAGPARDFMHMRLAAALRKDEPIAKADTNVAEQYRDIRATFPNFI